jgi:hypothetical protein
MNRRNDGLTLPTSGLQPRFKGACLEEAVRLVRKGLGYPSPVQMALVSEVAVDGGLGCNEFQKRIVRDIEAALAQLVGHVSQSYRETDDIITARRTVSSGVL